MGTYRSSWCLLLLALVPLGCRPSTPAANGPKLAVANTYLESAVRDLLGDGVTIVRLAEPGMCPGHFDLRPSQVTDLQSCRMLLRFEFQMSLDEKINSDGTNRPAVVVVSVPGGLCRPESYEAACRQMANAFVTDGWLSRSKADGCLQQISKRLQQRSIWAKKQVAQAGLTNAPVLASAHQKDFCGWLGLKVVAEFRPADAAQVSELDQAIVAGQSASVKLIIANLPEGRRTADALAERLGACVVVFGNFPELNNARVSFDELLQGNVAALLRAHRP